MRGETREALSALKSIMNHQLAEKKKTQENGTRGGGGQTEKCTEGKWKSERKGERRGWRKQGWRDEKVKEREGRGGGKQGSLLFL